FGDKNSNTLLMRKLSDVNLKGKSRMWYPKGLKSENRTETAAVEARSLSFFFDVSLVWFVGKMNSARLPSRYSPRRTKPNIKPPCKLTQRSIRGGNQYRTLFPL